LGQNRTDIIVTSHEDELLFCVYLARNLMMWTNNVENGKGIYLKIKVVI